MLHTKNNVKDDEDDPFEMVVSGLEVGAIQEDYYPIALVTSRGKVECRYYPVDGAKCGAIYVGGVGGGWDTPAKGLYPQLCQELTGEAIASLRVRFRHPTILAESVLDVLAGISYLESEGIDTVALIGHSFGGAVVIQAAFLSQAVRSIVTLASQSYGAAPACQLAPRCSILLIHGKRDKVLSPSCSQYIYSLSREPKHLILYDGADHGLDEVAEEVHQEVRPWIVEKLKEVFV
jgi:fermentation-respiration switch protein FrsA (DUF1100 family)